LEGKTALDLAKAEGNVEAAAALRAWAMEHGTLEPEPEPLSAEEKAELEKTMRQAARKGDTVQVQANLKAGADPNAADLLGETAMQRAAAANNVEGLEVLYSAGAEVDKTDDDGETPLIVAAVANAAAALKWLLEHSADWRLMAHSGIYAGKTALELAKNEESVEAAVVLAAWTTAGSRNMSISETQRGETQAALFTLTMIVMPSPSLSW
jgi:ankyrin repeat protein